jgi:hypothetical protein
MNWNDKDSYGERQLNISKCQIDTYHYIIYIYTHTQFNKVC